jgi:hypothetical protein
MPCGIQGCPQLATCYCAEHNQGTEYGRTYYCDKHAGIADAMNGE